MRETQFTQCLGKRFAERLEWNLGIQNVYPLLKDSNCSRTYLPDAREYASGLRHGLPVHGLLDFTRVRSVVEEHCKICQGQIFLPRNIKAKNLVCGSS